MAKFSLLPKFSFKAAPKPDTINLAGGNAYRLPQKLELISTLLTTFLKDEFYRSEKETIAQIQGLIDKVDDLQFVAKAAIYARQHHGMRSVSHLVAGELGQRAKGTEWTRHFFDRVVRRPDDVLEILGYQLGTYGRPIPNSMKRGLGCALSRFDDYQLAKYRREHASFKLVDAVNLLRPKATAPLGRLMRGELAAPETWEATLTKAGIDANPDDLATEKHAAWTTLVRGHKLGYLALLRNLRNILLHAPELASEVSEQLTQESAIRQSLVFPFQFLSAVEVLGLGNLPEASKLMEALNKAVDLSLANVPAFDGKTLVALDCSGSMQGRPLQIGALFAAVMVKSTPADLMVFSDKARYLTLNRRDSTLTLAKSIGIAQGGTNFNSIFEQANKSYDRIIILSDMQAWVGGGAPIHSFDNYRRRHNASPRIFSFDLKGYGSLQFPAPGVFALAGWSERSFSLLTRLDKDPTILISEVEAIPLAG